MPKAAVGQTGFTTGEVSPLFYGVTENPRYKKGLETGLNYIPTLQGPLTRRPGFKYCVNVKDSSNPPVFIPFKFSATQNYMLEFGQHYIRFYTNNGQVLTSGTTYGLQGSSTTNRTFYAIRDNTTPLPNEGISATATISTGSIQELQTPYDVADVPLLRWAQSGDTMFLFHPKYPPMKMQRQSSKNWKIEEAYMVDGPYMPLNSYAAVGDSATAVFAPQATTFQPDVMAVAFGTISNTTNETGAIGITTSAAHGLVTGQKVFISGVGGTTEANNWSSHSGRTSSNVAYWTVSVGSPTSFILLGSVYANAYTSGGSVYPAVFLDSALALAQSQTYPDFLRLMALNMGGVRYWGTIIQVYDAATVKLAMGGTAEGNFVAFPSTSSATSWQLGTWSGEVNNPGFPGNGFPACGVFHQDRLWVAGVPNFPQEVDSSNSGLYQTFSPSDYTNLNVKDNNSCSFVLNSEDQNPIRWMESTAQALLAGTYASEWAMTPSGASEALTPTNFNAQQTSFFGSAQIAPTKIGNAVMYVQRAARKLREMAFFFSAGTFRSIDVTEISEHITLPGLQQIAVQKETQPLLWGIRTDGVLTSLIYNRDDVSLSVGWMRHILGGQSDSTGTPPVVHSFGFIPDPLTTFDQMWAIIKRYINGSTVYTIEYMTKISDDSIAQEDSFQFDCGGTFDNPKSCTFSGPGSTTTVTSLSHGFSNGDQVRFDGVVGMNKTTTDVNGNKTVANLVNGKTFLVASATTNTFVIHDLAGNAVNSSTYDTYVSGGFARKLVSTISGISWLKGETVGVLADGGIHPDCVVSSGGAITLNYKAGKVQLGLRYKSQGKLLRADAGSADGTSIGKTRRTTRAAIQMHRCAELSIGTSFDNLIQIDFAQADQNQADTAVPLFSGIKREGLESAYDFESQLCFEQSSGLPGTIQSITTFMEEFDV